MADKKEKGTPEAAPAETQTSSDFSEAPPAPKRKKKNRKKIIRRAVTIAVAAALAGGGFFAWKKLHGNGDGGESQVITDIVQRGSITSTVEGSGAAVAKNSASVTIRASGTVREVYIHEGDEVEEGDLLYEVESA